MRNFTDCLFAVQIYLNWDQQLSSIEKLVLFCCGVFFVILPLIVNLVQLNREIQVWIQDTYSKDRVQAWIRSYSRGLYMMAILCGSSFAAVDIFNSNIFHLSMFNMGLNTRQRALFKNKRILSNVLLENLPQLIIQIIYVTLTIKAGISTITIVAMIFSTVSIISSIFDFHLSTLLMQCESITSLQMNIKSEELSDVNTKQFGQIIVHNRIPICLELSKIIRVDSRLIEILIPIQTKTGCQLTVYIRKNSNDNVVGSNIVKIIRQEIDSGELAQVRLIRVYLSFIYVQRGYSDIVRSQVKRRTLRATHNMRSEQCPSITSIKTT